MKRGRLLVFPLLLIFALLLGLFTACTGAEAQTAQPQFQNVDGRFTSRKITDESTALAAVGDAAQSLGIADVQTELADCTRTEALGSTFYRFAQTYQGVPVYGRSVVVSADASGNAELLTGNYSALSLNAAPRISETKASEKLKKKFKSAEIVPEGITVYSLFNTEPQLAWQFLVSTSWNTYRCFVSAKTGELIAQLPLQYTQSAQDETFVQKKSERNFYLHDFDGKALRSTVENDHYTFYLGDGKEETILNEAFRPYSEKLVTLTEKAIKVYDFFDSVLKRKGFNGQNGETHIAINGCEDDTTNACSRLGWTRTVTVLEFGSENSLSTDTVAHEFTHSVEQSISAMAYVGESGALMEALSDTFGEVIEKWSSDSCDWVHSTIRDLHDPLSKTELQCWFEYNGKECPLKKANGQHVVAPDKKPHDNAILKTCMTYLPMYPACYQGDAWRDTTPLWDEQGQSTNDNGNVHTNSTVVSHAAYLMAEGDGSGTALDTLTLARLLYKTLFTLPSDCTFAQFRRLTENMASVMNLSEGQRTRISWAFDQVGIYPQSVCYTVAPDCEITVLDAAGEVYEDYSAFYVNYPSDENSTVHALTHENGAALKLNVKSGEYYLRLKDNATGGTYSCRIKIGDKDSKKTMSLYTLFGDRKNAAAEGLVTDAFHEERPTAEGMTAVFALPQVNLDSEDARSFNQRVMDVWYADIKGTLESADDGEELTFWSVTYEWYVNGDVLSLLIKDDYEGGSYWDVNNFSVSTGAYLTTQEVYACAETEAWKETLRPAVAAAYCEYGAVSEYVSLNGRDEAFRSGLSRTIEEILRWAVPYFDENGELCVCTMIYLPDPGGVVDLLVNVERYEPTEDILTLIGGKSGGESALALLYRGVLRDYAEMGNYQYMLYDIDKDGTPELILHEYGYMHDVYTARDDAAVFIGYLTCYDNGLYQYDGNGIITYDGGQGRDKFQYLDLYTIENGELEYDSQLIGTEENSLEELMQMLETLTPVGDFLPVTDESYLQ